MCYCTAVVSSKMDFQCMHSRRAVISVRIYHIIVSAFHKHPSVIGYLWLCLLFLMIENQFRYDDCQLLVIWIHFKFGFVTALFFRGKSSCFHVAQLTIWIHSIRYLIFIYSLRSQFWNVNRLPVHMVCPLLHCIKRNFAKITIFFIIIVTAV